MTRVSDRASRAQVQSDSSAEVSKAGNQTINFIKIEGGSRGNRNAVRGRDFHGRDIDPGFYRPFPGQKPGCGPKFPGYGDVRPLPFPDFGAKPPGCGIEKPMPIIDGGCFPEPLPPVKENPYQQIVEQLSALVQQLIGTVTDLLSKFKTPETPPPAVETPPPAETTPPPAETAPPPAADKPAKETSKLAGSNNEFIWKPESDKDGKLAIILPSKLTGDVKAVRIVDKDGKVIEKGDYSGLGNPGAKGDREHFRFNKAGGKYPDGCQVQIVMNNGTIKTVDIKETSKRLER